MKMLTDVKGEGDLLVLVGGGLTGWLSWVPHQKRLAPTRKVARAQPLAVQRGLENRPLPDRCTVKTESAALAATIDGLQAAGPVDIVAWSYGALITLDYALDHPDRIRTLTLIEPPAFWTLPATGKLDSPGDYRCVAMAEGEIAKEVNFTVGADGEIAPNACRDQITLLRQVNVLGSKDLKVSNIARDASAGARSAFFGRVALKSGCPPRPLAK